MWSRSVACRACSTPSASAPERSLTCDAELGVISPASRILVKDVVGHAETSSMQLSVTDTLDYDAYGIHGSLERIRKVAGRVWETRAAGGPLADCELEDLRAALYLNQRAWHSDTMAIEADIGIEWELIEAIDEASGGLGRDRPIVR